VNLKRSISKVVRVLPTLFEPGELPYYLSTSKSELHLRDRIAFCLQSEYPLLTCLREYKRSDLVIVSDSGPVCHVEFKLIYASGVAIGYSPSLAQIRKLTRQMSKLGVGQSYGIIFLPNLSAPSTSSILYASKKAYFDLAARAESMHPGKVTPMALEQCKRLLSEHYHMQHSIQKVGNSIGVDVELLTICIERKK